MMLYALLEKVETVGYMMENGEMIQNTAFVGRVVTVEYFEI